jgi:hypothetical protein
MNINEQILKETSTVKKVQCDFRSGFPVQSDLTT